MAKFKLELISPLVSPASEKEIIAFLTVRNEATRLPYLFDYYRRLGVDKFFVIDNNSQDDTRNFLLGQKDATVFYTKNRFFEHWSWNQHLFLRFGLNNWCLRIDADEILIYPHSDKLNLKDLCNFFDQEGSKTVHCLLLDMYSNVPIKNAVYKKGYDPIESASWFDPTSHFKLGSRYYGGMRKRVFGIEKPCISKFPLFRITKDLLPDQGMHRILMTPRSNIRGALLHFKYNSDFVSKARIEAKRGEYWNNAVEYKSYAKKIKDNPNLNLSYSGSVKFSNNQQLIRLGIMESSDIFEEFVRSKA